MSEHAAGRIVLVRSADTDYDAGKRIAGNLDLPLSARGAASLNELAKELAAVPGLDPQVVYAAAGEAPLATAERLGEVLGVKVKPLPALLNLNFGCWQGLQLDELRRKHPTAVRQFEDDPSSVCPPGGEMVADALARISKIMKALRRKHADDTIVLVAPDPLRQLLACQLRQQALEFSWPGEDSGPRWETLPLANGQPPAGGSGATA